MNIIKLTTNEGTILCNLDFVVDIQPRYIPYSELNLHTIITMSSGTTHYVEETLQEIEQIAALLPKSLQH